MKMPDNTENIFDYNLSEDELKQIFLTDVNKDHYLSTTTDLRKLIDLHFLFSLWGDNYHCDRIVNKLREQIAKSWAENI